jgi:hypothetical protein
MKNSSPYLPRSDTVNARRYESANAQVYLNSDGQPVAFRRVRILQHGTFTRASVLFTSSRYA